MGGDLNCTFLSAKWHDGLVWGFVTEKKFNYVTTLLPLISA